MEPRILLVCNAGMSTSMLVNKMNESAQERNISANIEAVSDPEASELLKKEPVDVILLGPQVRYLESSYKQKYPEIPTEVINMSDYGTMNGVNVLNRALEIISEEA